MNEKTEKNNKVTFPIVALISAIKNEDRQKRNGYKVIDSHTVLYNDVVYGFTEDKLIDLTNRKEIKTIVTSDNGRKKEYLKTLLNKGVGSKVKEY